MFVIPLLPRISFCIRSEVAEHVFNSQVLSHFLSERYLSSIYKSWMESSSKAGLIGILKREYFLYNLKQFLTGSFFNCFFGGNNRRKTWTAGGRRLLCSQNNYNYSINLSLCYYVYLFSFRLVALIFSSLCK